MSKKKAVIIGSGIGGLSLGIRLLAMGLEVEIVEKLDKPGGRGYQKIEKVPGIGDFVFDMGPTVLTVPYFIEELFSLEHGKPFLPDFPEPALDFSDAPSFSENGKSKTFSNSNNTQKYVNIVPISPFYRVFFADGSYFDYDGDTQSTYDQIEKLVDKEEAENYLKFLKEAKKVFKKGFIELGYNYFGDLLGMLKIMPELLKLRVIRNLFKYNKRFFKSQKIRQIFSFETLLVGGNPYSVPAIYVLVHFVERTWGIHFSKGGTGKLIEAFVKKFTELGGKLHLNTEIKQIEIHEKKAVGIRNSEGTVISADLVISNGDVANTYLQLLKNEKRFWNRDLRYTKLTEYSMSLVVIYFGFKRDLKEDLKGRLQHHNIIFAPEYAKELDQIFNKKTLQSEFSQYLHIPTLTDPSLAPNGYHTAYTLACVPNLKGGQNWSEIGEKVVDSILDSLDKGGIIPNLKNRLVHTSYITPDYFENTLNSYLGNAFGIQPLFRHTALFRPNNKSGDFENLYFVGAGTQPGAGTPSVMMSAKITARLIAKDLGLSFGEM